MLEEEKMWTDLARNNHLPLDQKLGAASVLADLLFCESSDDVLHRQPERSILKAFALISENSWSAAVTRHFDVRDPKSAPMVVDAVVKEMGEPKRSGDRRWNDVPVATREAIDEFLKLRLMDEFFEGEHERGQYWRKWTNKIYRVRSVLDGNAIFIWFDTFGVVEFRNVGNAAYFYDTAALDRLSEKSIRWVGDLKRPREVGFLCKLSHTSGWCSAFDATLRKMWMS